MTHEEILTFQAKEKTFYNTDIGKAYLKFKHAHSHYWQKDLDENISTKTLKLLAEKVDQADTEFRKLLEELMAKA